MKLAVLVIALLVQVPVNEGLGRIVRREVGKIFPPLAGLFRSRSGPAVSQPAVSYPVASHPAVSQQWIVADDISENTDPAVDAETKNRMEIKKLLSRGVVDFALNINREIQTKSLSDNPNVIFSPLNIVSAMAMVLLGSAGVTFEQVSKILGLESEVDILEHSEIVHSVLGSMLQSIETGTKDMSLGHKDVGPKVALATRMFVQDGFPIRNVVKKICKKTYNNKITLLNFTIQPDESMRRINNWVNSSTYGKIPSILTKPIDAQTSLIIASALYFDGEWQTFFSMMKSRTPFAVTPTESVDVDMMYNSGNFPFFEDKTLKAKILGLPYKGKAKSARLDPEPQAMMYVVLPTDNSAQALTELINNLNRKVLENMMGQMRNTACTVFLPRMQLSSNLNLREAVESLGLTSLFDPSSSNLGVLSGGYLETETEGPDSYDLGSLRRRIGSNLANPGIYATDILHKVEMNVTETGTTAAAATAVIMRRMATRDFHADKPFLFFIRHESTEMILFWGTINKPTPNY